MTAKKQAPAKVPAVLEPQCPSVKAPPHVGPDCAKESEVESLKKQLQALQDRIRLHESEGASPVLQKPVFSPPGSLSTPAAVCAAAPAAVPKCPSPAVASVPKATVPAPPASTVSTPEAASDSSGTPASMAEAAPPPVDPDALEQMVDLSPEETCLCLLFFCCYCVSCLFLCGCLMVEHYVHSMLRACRHTQCTCA